jgi:hypothetical protein
MRSIRVCGSILGLWRGRRNVAKASGPCYIRTAAKGQNFAAALHANRGDLVALPPKVKSRSPRGMPGGCFAPPGQAGSVGPRSRHQGLSRHILARLAGELRYSTSLDPRPKANAFCGVSWSRVGDGSSPPFAAGGCRRMLQWQAQQTRNNPICHPTN